jgi:hypothetical protein
MEISDFNSFMIGAELDMFAGKYLSIGFGFDYYSKSVISEHHHFFSDDGIPVGQEIQLKLIPAFITLKLFPFGKESPVLEGIRGTRILPWIGMGLTLLYYDYNEYIMEYVDGKFNGYSLGDWEGFTSSNDDPAIGFHFCGGVILPINSEWNFFSEARYSSIKVDLFQKIRNSYCLDLSGLTFTCGVSYSF